MTIAWNYLDKKAAAADALKDLSSMEFILSNHPSELEEARAHLTSYRASVLSDLPKAPPNPHAGEAKMAAWIDEIDVMRERYRQALEFMEWFRPAWAALSDDEQFILTEFYRNDEEKQRFAVDNICSHFHIERSSAYNKKNRALARLSLLLYGK